MFYIIYILLKDDVMNEIQEIFIKRAIIEGKSAKDLSSCVNLNDSRLSQESDCIFSLNENLQEKQTCYLNQKPPVILDKRGQRDNFFQKALKFIFNGTCFMPDERSEDLKEDFDYKITDDDKGYVHITKKTGDKIEKSGFYSYNDPKYNINGEIDAEVLQGRMENCGFISLIYSMAQNDKGREIIKNAISPNYNENNEQDGYNVYFKGLDETYTITQAEIDAALNKRLEYDMGESEYYYAQGDKDMVLLELAWNKCCVNDSQALNNIEHQGFALFYDDTYPKGLSGTYQYELFYALTGGKFIENIDMDKAIKEAKDTLRQQKREAIEKQLSQTNEFKLSDFSIVQDIILANLEGGIDLELNLEDSYEITEENNDEKTVTIKNKNTGETYSIEKDKLISTMVGMRSTEEQEKLFEIQYQKALESDIATLSTSCLCNLTDINGGEVQLMPGHAYGIKYIDENQVILVNPWNTSEEIIVSKEELKKQFYSQYKCASSCFKLHYGNIE